MSVLISYSLVGFLIAFEIGILRGLLLLSSIAGVASNSWFRTWYPSPRLPVSARCLFKGRCSCLGSRSLFLLTVAPRVPCAGSPKNASKSFCGIRRFMRRPLYSATAFMGAGFAPYHVARVCTDTAVAHTQGRRLAASQRCICDRHITGILYSCCIRRPPIGTSAHAD